MRSLFCFFFFIEGGAGMRFVLGAYPLVTRVRLAFVLMCVHTHTFYMISWVWGGC